MKRFISLIIAVILVFSFTAPTLAASNRCGCGTAPVVFVPGFGEAIYLNPGKDNEVSVFPPSTDAIMSAIPDIIKALAGVIIAGDYDAFGTYVMEGAEKMLGQMACDENGNPLENVGIDTKELPSVDTHKNTLYDYCSHLVDEPTGDYNFIYDWRLDPMDNAKGLKEFIDRVKEITGHKKVVLACHSQGNTVVASYLYLYGSSSIEKLLFLSPAFQGLSLIGAIMTRDVSLAGKDEALNEFLRGVLGYETLESQLVGAIVSILNDYGITGYLLNYIQKILTEQFDRIMDEFLIDTMGTMPGVWSFVPDECYEEAKELNFKGNEKYDALVKKLDRYHYNVQNNIVKIINKAKASGTAVVIVAGYDISSIPVAGGEANHSDFLIDTKYMSIGATCAPIGKTLGDGYKQAKRSCGHNHVSPDNTIDASTCAYPEYTWFVRGNPHNGFGSAYRDFLTWAVLYDGQPTVRSSKLYPQFIQLSDGELSPVTSPRTEDTRMDEVIAFEAIYYMIKNAVVGL
ncbi:MAG: hypothetical protein IJF57_01190 [Clostridia bacterium]|nr:hypothetical protein [Clostridia bacterium]